MARKKNRQSFEKRRKEMKRKRKQEEKRERRFNKNKPPTEEDLEYQRMYGVLPDGSYYQEENAEADTGVNAEAAAGAEVTAEVAAEPGGEEA